ncbi:DMT family transporter [Plantibacter sp. MMLR14_011]|uniref:DMT family transporter n=1 Tax=Plantibacter sp. MMLR14_011 TaxID=1898746 RepID=UPI0008DCCDAE|nr:DMT family transporter [Plantibacter sp. MMLR14_011]OII40809.1 multidrug DMT transporter permease [Plantibacter sp. MMLR14_011]
MIPSAIDIADLADDFTRNPSQLLGIPFALLGAVFLSLGAQLQHRGVAKVESSSGTDATSGLNVAQLLALLSRPSWVTGTVMLGLAIVLQLGSLSLAPITLVQPLGAVALVITAVVNSRISGVRLNRRSVVAIVACVGGVGLFVTIAAVFTGEHRITEAELVTILVMLGVVLLVFGLGFMVFRARFTAIFYIVGTGVLYGFVATLAKVIIGRLQQGEFDWLTFLCGLGLVAASALGGYFVQTAYSSGPPDLVIAGLTVIDPMIAVGIGIIVLGEASNAPFWAGFGFVVAGAIAVWGVFQLARHHPQVSQTPAAAAAAKALATGDAPA